MVRDQEPLFAREGLFRQRLNQLRKEGRINQGPAPDSINRLKELEHGNYLANVQSTLSQQDPKEMERITLLDSVTQLYNHSTVTRALTDELKKSKRYKRNCSVLVLLVDGLYGIQQSYGYETADSILKGVADFVMNEVRDVDIPARYSAEELLVVCPETDAKGTAILAERIRTKICLERVSDIGQNWHVTCSIGIASFPDSAATLEELVEKARVALNQSIDNGGNSVSFA
ncbi:MAG: GGDEF domain-containing protein [Cyanobacteria bacterium TGS_CYA1]|nr:GGDEF domain-containing protein [Cyanobacteria bacterium TGS_CYA1]MDX2105380.1 GGDEF domain-containing protein [Candidatus Melainabacteria bacterium]